MYHHVSKDHGLPYFMPDDTNHRGKWKIYVATFDNTEEPTIAKYTLRRSTFVGYSKVRHTNDKRLHY